MTVHPDSPLESNIEAQRFTGIELGRGKEQGRWPLKMPTSVCGRGRERERDRDSIYDCKSNRVPGARVGEDEEF